jgi:hypothetical protein
VPHLRSRPELRSRRDIGAGVDVNFFTH